MIVYFNGSFLEKSRVAISPDDRGFLFSDGAYEVIRGYDGTLFEAKAHYARLASSLEKLSIRYDDVEKLPEIADRLFSENAIDADQTKLYIQITRGAAERSHRFPPPDTEPTVYAAVSPMVYHKEEIEHGIAAITLGDIRWSRCDIKSISLLPNVLAHQRALDAGAAEAIFIRDGVITEATHNSVFAVFDNEIHTAPLSNLVLPGITRAVTLELAESLGFPIMRVPIAEEHLPGADEVFVTGTQCEITPVVTLDGVTIGSGKPGSVTRTLQHAFYERLAGSS